MEEKRGRGRPVKFDEAFINTAADQALEFAKKEDSLSMLGYRAKYGYTYPQIKYWNDNSEYFYKLYSQAKAIIGSRRENGGVTGKFNSGMVEKRGWQYDDEVRYREDELRQDPISNQKNPSDRAEESKHKCKG